ncbi:anaerobic ribonucleoside-triphosphate reductase activating protein [Methanothermococcus thermolithotrophicus]|uniref:anaerobic ribonucleoside-triphosphate reductase activating protein n=1 Tax=Methanothermococcus thermolithotrophicus TaxID=2186 RepID=UPI000370A382|nr:anaerobic ribonucleoside-triphosphate reductase activating protein [Methanothermococcus thermolithotrophicus]MDK2987904.1 pyruvate formate lyase activating enzyme [Methanothermococcus sp.]
MKVSGIVELSTIDYPKKCSAVVFLSGCNMKCGYCYNYKHITERSYEMSAEEVFKNMDLMFAEALVISGGEPTLQPEGVKELCKLAKEKGFPVKIDTNGTNVDVIRDLVENKLVDYVAVDVKCRFDKYKELTGIDGETIKENILKIINICKENNVFIECRTTFIPTIMDKEDIEEIASTIKDCDMYAIQQFDNEHAYCEEFKKIKTSTTEELLELGKIAKNYIDNVVVRTLDGEFRINNDLMDNNKNNIKNRR